MAKYKVGDVYTDKLNFATFSYRITRADASRKGFPKLVRYAGRMIKKDGSICADEVKLNWLTEIIEAR